MFLEGQGVLTVMVRPWEESGCLLHVSSSAAAAVKAQSRHRHLSGVSSHQGLVYDTSLGKAKYSGLHADRTGLSSLPGLRYLAQFPNPFINLQELHLCN